MLRIQNQNKEAKIRKSKVESSTQTSHEQKTQQPVIKSKMRKDEETRKQEVPTPKRAKPKRPNAQNEENKAIRRDTNCVSKPKTNEAETKNQNPTRPPVNKFKEKFFCNQETRKPQEPPRISITAG